MKCRVFDRSFFDMPRGTGIEWAFETFKQKASEAGGVVSDELLAEFKGEVADAISRSEDDIEMMGNLEGEYN